MSLKALSLAAVATAVFATPALAHHSFAMFDQSRTVTLKGTVKELEWANPHSWIRLMVHDQASGKDVQYAFEMGSPARSTFDGWTRDTIKPGDIVSVTIAPLKDGSRGGMYLGIDLPGGKHLGRTGPAVGLITPRNADGTLAPKE